MSVGGSTVVADGWGWRFGAIPSSSVDGVSFTINEGERVLLLGPSGSGKSTLLRGLAGLLAEDEGSSSGALRIDGQDPREHNSRVGFVLQDPESQAVLQCVGDDIAFGCENFGVPTERIWSRVNHSLELVGLDVDLNHSTTALSGGQKQRLALAGALAIEPSLLLLDEPTANLDPEGAQLVREAVQLVADSTRATIILVEHRLDLWWDFADRVIVLDATGGLLADGAPEHILATQRSQLVEAGIWLPHFRPEPPAHHARGPALLSLIDLVACRPENLAQPLTAQIHAGEMLAITGPNGVGKSTLALTLGGLIPQLSGRLQPQNELSLGVRGTPIDWTSRQLHTRIGSVFQSPSHQFVRASARAELALSAKTAGLAGRGIEVAVDEMLERLRLTAKADTHPFALSGGQQRRLSVATALIAKPALLILDEPTFGQDAVTWAELVELMHQLCHEGRAIVAMTHDRNLTRVATRELTLSASLVVQPGALS
jgi:energy-coupling factor transporter ATP-binding protein EcfA2